MDNTEAFNYTYSAKEQEEIKAIRKKYSSPKQTEDKMAQLRRLDAAVTQKACVYSLAVGIIGALVLGFGMSLVMTDIGELVGVLENISLPIGIVTGAVGIVLVSLAYPIYNRLIKKERQKIAPQIIKLTDELMK